MKTELLMNIYQTEEGYFVFSAEGTWVVGVYEDELCCAFAYQIPDEKLHELWEEVLKRDEYERFITLKALAKIAPDIRIGSLFG